LDAVGTPIAVQQKLMRHSDIRTTMNVYGDVVDDRAKEAHSKVASLAFGNAEKVKISKEKASTSNSRVGSSVRSV
jgi:hypothetical protein